MTETNAEPAPERVTDAQEKIAQNVRAVVARRRVRQTEIQAALGLSESTVSRRMAGASSWKAAELVALSVLCDCPLPDLYGPHDLELP